MHSLSSPPAFCPCHRPRFLPFRVLSRRPLSASHGGVSTSTERASTAGGGYVDRTVDVATARRVPTMAPSRSEPLCRSNEDMGIVVRPRTTLWEGGSTDSPRIRGGRIPISPEPTRTPRRIRPPPRQPKILPRNYRKHAMYGLPRSTKSRRPTIGSTTHDEPRLGSSRVCRGYDREEETPLNPAPQYTGCRSADVRDGGEVCGGTALDPDTPPFVATWSDEETADGLMHGGLLWRESGFGRETELTAKGTPQGIAEACRLVR